jgi:dihydropteroate synthase
MKVKKKSIRNLNDAERVMESLDVHSKVRKMLAEKSLFHVLEIDDVSPPAANIMKQIAISRGSDAIVNQNVIINDIEKSTVLLPGTVRELRLISEELKKQDFGLPGVGDQILNILKKDQPAAEFLIMGVLNITPDSFSDGGNYFSKQAARARFKEMEKEGADIIDVGAESSRPGSARLDVREELNRLEKVFPLFEEVSVPVSIDTYKAEVAEIALSRGATIVNDISALRMDEKMVDVLRHHNCKVVLMHMKGTPETMQDNPDYDDVIREIRDFFEERVEFCLANGISKNRIILDPGIGFGKRQEDNLKILSRLEEFTSDDFPILIGASRKSFIGKITGEEETERLDGSIASAIYSYLKGASIFRVHNVKETKNALSVISAILEEKW